MGAYIVRRLMQLVFVLFLVSVLVFLLMRLLPGDPIRMYLTTSQLGTVTEEQIEKVREENGLNKPLVVQYVNWVGGVVKGDLGKSIIYGTPVAKDILSRFPATLQIGLLGFIIGTFAGIVVGIVCAIRRGGWLDNLLTTLANIGITLPVFWLAEMLVLLFSVKLRWLPITGYVSPFENFGENLKDIILPVMCVATFPLASVARQARSSMLEVMRQDYVRTAWSAGLRERSVVVRHALKNGLIPVVTLSGMNLGMVVGGEVMVEKIFNIPGIGREAVNAVMSQDYPYVQGIVLIVAFLVLLINLITDVSYGWIDPRIRYS
jgi:peptide/nickel transport system permease protein